MCEKKGMHISMAAKRRKGKSPRKILQEKLRFMIFIIILAFCGLGVRLYTITTENQSSYQKKILSQQRYDSTTLPFKRGTITDKNGTILAVSEKVYNVILDCKVMLDDELNKEPTLKALADCFSLDYSTLNQYVEEHPGSQYYVLKKKLAYEEIQPFLERQEADNAAANENNKLEDAEKMGKVSGVWFEDEYIRKYPNGSLACDAIGFTGSDNNGTYGLEEYYNDELNGTNGREYGYLNDDATLERTTVAAVDGNSLTATIDANIQSIVEKYILQFNKEHENEAREGLGSNNTACIVMNPNTGEVLAMASYPTYDLNNPKDLTAYYTQEEIDQMIADDTYYDTLNRLWRNFCISDTYEPGSTAKAITIATGIETGKITGNETYECTGRLEVGGHTIKCNVKTGHGVLDVSGALEQSCNVALMKMGEAIGSHTLVEFENIFNLGLRTNIDLAGEARTASLIYTEDTMHEAEVATTSFGQGFNVTMIQMATAYSSIVNGGYYYEPHMVSKITNSSGDVIKNIEPRILKQTISNTTSQVMKSYLRAVVDEGTGAVARPAGYTLGGKTGTAEMAGRDRKNYVVSFIGHAPADDPQIVIYMVIDQPNVEDQAHAYYASGVVKNILTEVLPYLNITKTEEMTIAEQEEVDKILGTVTTPEEETTKYIVNPETGELIDSETGEVAEQDFSTDGDAADTAQNTEETAQN